VADGGLSIGRMLFGGLLVGALILGVVMWLLYLQLLAMADERREMEAQGVAETAALRYAARVSGVETWVTRVARDPEVAAAVAQGDEAALAAQQERMRRLYPEISRILFLPPGDKRPDPEQSPPFGYACIDLVRSAEAGGKPPVEVHVPGTEHAHIDIARPVVRDGAVVGTLLVSLETVLLERWLAENGGYLELRQVVAGSTRTLATAGDPGRRAGRGHVAAVPGSRWEMVVWSGEMAPLSLGEQAGLGSVVAAALAALVLLFVVLAILIGRAVRGDLVRLVHLVVETCRGKRHHGFNLRLAEFRQVAQALDQRLGQRTVTPGTPVPESNSLVVEEVESDGDGFEDMPSVLFVDESSLTVEEQPHPDETPHDKDTQQERR